MEPFRFVDADGRAWDVWDFRVVDNRRRALPVNSWRAEARAFVPADDRPVMVYAFGYVAYHVTEPKILNDQLHFAKPLNASAAERMTGG